ncbi:MAG: glycosyltransferase family A protein [Burkholderia gladioli]
MSTFDITAVINGHAEGLLAHASLRSLKQSADFAEQHGLRVEWLAVLDRPTALTVDVFDEFARAHPALRVLRVDHGDLGYSRNTAAEAAQGDYIAFLDADDIWSEDWLLRAHACARADSRDIAWHPEVNVYFGVARNLFLHMDMEDPRFHLANLAYSNAWTSLCFVRTAFLRSVPYAGTHLKHHIGYEDWCWNIDVIEHGGLHKIVPHTAHAIRSRHVSLVKQTAAAGCIPRPSDLFRKHIAGRPTAPNADRSKADDTTLFAV